MKMVMKMAAVSTISLLLLCCSSISSTDPQEQCDRFAAAGENVTLPLLHPLEASDSLRWTHNKQIILYRRQGSFVLGRKEDASENGSLKLVNMEKSKVGSYTPQVHDKTGNMKGKLRSIHLCMQDRILTPPTVTTECTPSFVTFTCQHHQAKDLSIEWQQNDKPLQKVKGQTLTRIPKEVQTDSFVCRVSNSVSSQSSSPVTQSCLSPSIFPKTVFGINTWVLVGVGGGIVLVLIVSVIVCCIRAKRKKRTQLKDEKELRLAWTNDQMHQHNPAPDHHRRHRQQQPVGHTGPRQHRSKLHREQQRPRVPDHGGSTGLPQPSPRRPAQAPRPEQSHDEQPPPLPQPRKKAAKNTRA